MKTACIRMRGRVTRRFTHIQAVWHSEKIFTNFMWHWSLLKIEADKILSRQLFFCGLRVNSLVFLGKASSMQNKPLGPKTYGAELLIHYVKVSWGRVWSKGLYKWKCIHLSLSESRSKLADRLFKPLTCFDIHLNEYFSMSCNLIWPF